MGRTPRRGRPALTINIPAELRKRLEDTAEREGRTITMECVRRLSASFQDAAERRQPAQKRAS